MVCKFILDILLYNTYCYSRKDPEMRACMHPETEHNTTDIPAMYTKIYICTEMTKMYQTLYIYLFLYFSVNINIFCVHSRNVYISSIILFLLLC